MSQGFPQRRARMEYVCMNCGHRHPVDQLLYTCPDCGGVLLLEDLDFDEMKEKGAQYWRDLFDARRATRHTALRGIFRFYELMAPVLEEDLLQLLIQENGFRLLLLRVLPSMVTFPQSL